MNVTRTKLIGLALAIFAGTLWLYWPSVKGGFLAGMDDDEYLRQAVRLKGLSWDAVEWAFTTTQYYYYPLPRLSHMLDYQIWGASATGHHATSVMLHALNATLVFGFLWTLLIAVTPLTTGERLMVALGVAVVFAIHPLQVESVAWISVRTQLLCTAFGIGCLWASAGGARRWVVWALFAGALLCKPTAAAFLFAMLAMDYFPLRRLESLGWRKWLRQKAVLIALAVAASVAALITESSPNGLMAPLEAVRLPQRLFLAVQSLTFYPWKLVWPARLSPNYPLGLGFSLRPPLVLASALCVGIVTALSLWRRRRTPALAAAWGAYVMLILPVSGLLQRGPQAVADRYAYAAMLPLLLLAAGAVVWLWRRSAMAVRFALAGLLGCELFFLGVRARAQTSVWRNDETLWRAVLAQFPNSWMASYDLGVAVMQAGRVPEAIKYFEQALQLKPDWAAAHNNLGAALLAQGRSGEAIGHFQKALEINPDYAEAHNDLGGALATQGRYAEAMEHYRKAVQIKPDYPDAYYNLAYLLAAQGQSAEAIRYYEQVIRFKPDYADAHQNLANLLAAQGRLDEAIGHYQRAVELKPGSAQAHYSLGLALQDRRKFAAAIGQYRKVLELEPRHALACNNLAWLLATCPEASLRDGHKAIELAQRAERLSGSEHAEVLDTLAAAYAEAGRFGEAAETARRALALGATQNNESLVGAIRTRLKLYEANSPYREQP